MSLLKKRSLMLNDERCLVVVLPACPHLCSLFWWVTVHASADGGEGHALQAVALDRVLACFAIRSPDIRVSDAETHASISVSIGARQIGG